MRPGLAGRTLLLFGVACVLVAHPAHARRRNQPYFQIFNRGGEISMETSWDHDIRDASGQEKVEENEWSLGEEVSFRGDGWVYHPAMLQFSGEVGVLWEQNYVRTEPSGGSNDVTGSHLRYDVSGTMFPYKPYPFTMFANQSRTRVNSPLAPSRVIDSMRYGAGLELRELTVGDYTLPTRFLYRHFETETNSIGTRAGDDRSRDEFRVYIDNETESTRNRVDYRWDSLESSNGALTTETTRQDLRLLQRRQFSAGELTSRLVARDESNKRDFQSVNLTEGLILTHSGRLSSSYGYSFNYQDAEISTQRSHTGHAGISHQLYESLSSTAGVGGTTATFDNGDIHSWNGRLGFIYSKLVPRGRLGLRFAPSYTWQKENTDGGTISVADEDHAVTLTEDIPLDSLQVLEDTVVVFDPLSGLVFAEGLDYDIIVSGVVTSIRVRPGGLLDPLAAFAVDYDFESRPARTFSTQTFSYGASLNLLEHYTWDVSYSQTDQDLLDGPADDPTLTDSRRTYATFDARFQHNQTHLEFEHVREDISPRKRWSASHNLNFRPRPDASLGATVGYSRTEITDVGRVTESYGASANTTAWLPYRILAHLNLMVRQLNQEEQETLGVGLSLGLTYRYGRLLFELTDDFTWRRTDTTDRETQSELKDTSNLLFFKVTREF